MYPKMYMGGGILCRGQLPTKLSCPRKSCLKYLLACSTMVLLAIKGIVHEFVKTSQ